MNFQELAAKRYSVRNFRQTPIPKAVIDQILMAGNAAPTAHNNQPQEILTEDHLRHKSTFFLRRFLTFYHWR